ncbi:tail protein [Arthrobacter phage Heisenberger]|uniref:Minor tail protein n=1 Tax=Arthrobacter phage Heisenberger TaxID=2024277 RepID=A0A222Z6Y2_9CAUD|nr:tail protein [Arthrobacter phage Heisenberger]ASR80272.1 minor tail protein [Arthrobacter phage Heisenberger]
MMTPTYDTYPGVDENNEFPPPVRAAFANSSELLSKITSSIASNSAVVDGAAAQALNGVGLIPKWKANTSYAVDQWAISPRGNFIICKTAHTSPSTFSEATEVNWTFINGGPRKWLPFGADLDTYRTSAGGVSVWLMPSQAYVDTYVNWPADLPKAPGLFIVHGDYINGSTIIFGQTVWTYGATYGKRERTTRSGAAWNPWVDPYASGTINTGLASDYALSNQSLRDAFRRRRGSLGTNNVTAIAIRLDHGAVYAKDKCIPKFVQHGLPWSIAINPGSGRLALAENAGITWSEYHDWVKNKGGEILNHGMDHADASTSADLKIQLVDSKPILQTNIPTQAIEVFAVPGVGGTNMNGWTSTNTPEHFTSAYEAARLVLENHAFSTGYTPGLYRELDGYPSNGETHYTMDSAATASDVIARIQNAQNYGTGLQLMLHPSQMDTAGNITTTTFNEIMDWIASERDAGRLVVLSTSGLFLADMHSSVRHNLLRNPELQGTNGWNTSGYTGFTGFAQSNTSAGQISQNIDLTNRAHHAGSLREITAKFTADSSGGIARLQIEHVAAGINVVKDVTLSANEVKTVRFSALMPIWSGSNLPTYRAGRLSGGAIKVENPGVLAV